MQAQIAEALSSGAQMPAAPAISSAQAQTSFRLQGQQYAVGPSYSSSIQDQIQQLRRQSDIGMTPPSQTPPSQPPMMMIPGRVGGVPTNPLSVHNVSQQHQAFLPQQLNQYPTAQGSRHLSTAPPPLGIHSSATTFAATNRHTMLQPLGSTGIQQSQQDQFQHQQQQQRPQQHYRASRQETKQGSNSDGGDHHEDDDFINFIDSVLGPAHHHPQPPPSSDKS